MVLKDYLVKIQNRETLTEDEMMFAMGSIMDGECSDSEIAALLMGLSMRGETIEEITGAAKVMRHKAHKISAPDDAVDCCGTGGDQSGSYNISTAVALVSAACGVPIAKHGNRAASSKSGTADVLETLGINLDAPQDILEDALREIGFAFLMAPAHHPAVKHVRSVRKAMGIRTLFNIIGPLANPAGTKFQLIGVYDKNLVVPIAEALAALGSERAWVVHGDDGMDEITVTTTTLIAELNNGIVTSREISPEDFGLPRHAPEELKGGDPEHNAKALTALLEGQAGAYRDIVLANTAAVLKIHGDVSLLTEGVEKAADAIDSGKALKLMEDYRRFTNGEF